LPPPLGGPHPSGKLRAVEWCAKAVIGSRVKSGDPRIQTLGREENEDRYPRRSPAYRATCRDRIIRGDQHQLRLENAEKADRTLLIPHRQHVVSFAGQQTHKLRFWPAVNQQDPHRDPA
jgi:hypothetical protein